MSEFRLSRFQRFRDSLNLLFATGQLRSDLSSILADLHAQSPLEDRVEAIQKLMEWIRLPIDFDRADSAGSRAVRFRFLLQFMERNPEWKLELARTVHSILVEASAVGLFCQTGLSHEAGFFAEAIDRVMRRWLPQPGGDGDLAELLSRVFTREADADWIESSPEAVVGPVREWLAMVADSPARLEPLLQKAMHDALVVLGATVAAIGVSKDVDSRLSSSDISQSPFIALNRLISQAPTFAELSALPEVVARCRTGLAEVFAHIESAGVSVGLVYKLEKLGAALNRAESLYHLGLVASEVERDALLPRFVGSLIRDEVMNRNLTSFLSGNLHLLARKIVERSGHTGEHYIARNRRERLQMLASAGGGGILTVFTALLKIWIAKLGLALFFEGLFSWCNYAGSFLLMQGLGFTLATKQPSMTASALSSTLERYRENRDSLAVAEEIAQITRSQGIAALGNLAIVIPGAVLFDLLWRKLWGHSVMTPEYAQHFIESIHPFRSLTIPFAALTGVFLWAASVCAGWSENWVVYRRLPLVVARSRRLNQVFGRERVQRWSHGLGPWTAGLMGNVSLGFFLSYTPIVGRFFGVPLDVRHVTLSTGALSLAICAIGWGNLAGSTLTFAIMGIILIGLLNFGVSFVCALEVAARARNIKHLRLTRIFRLVSGRLLGQPNAQARIESGGK